MLGKFFLSIHTQKFTECQKCSLSISTYFVDRPNYVQYSMVYMLYVLSNGRFQIISFMGFVQIHYVFHHTPKKKNSKKTNGFKNNSLHKRLIQECHRHTSHSFIILKVNLGKLNVCQSHNERIENIVIILLEDDNLRENNMFD